MKRVSFVCHRPKSGRTEPFALPADFANFFHFFTEKQLFRPMGKLARPFLNFLVTILSVYSGNLKATSYLATPSTFDNILKSAKPGDTIELGKLNYGGIRLYKQVFKPPISINNGVFSGVSVVGSDGITMISPTVVRLDPDDKSTGIGIYSSANIQIKTPLIKGVHNSNGVNINDSSFVSVTNGRVSGLVNAIRGVRNSNICVLGNLITDIQVDGIAFGDTSDLLIADNTFADFHRMPKDHPDAVQIWNKARPNLRNIFIRRNIIRTDSQGIFVQNEGDGYDNVQITQNRVISGFSNSIKLSGSRNSLIVGNISSTLENGTLKQAKVWLQQNQGLTFAYNDAEFIVDRNNNYKVLRGNNLIRHAVSTVLGSSPLPSLPPSVIAAISDTVLCSQN